MPLAQIALAALLLAACGLLPFSNATPSSSPNATPTLCGCVLEDLVSPTPSQTATGITPLPSFTPDYPAVTQNPQLSATIQETPTSEAAAPSPSQVLPGEVETSLLSQPLSYLVYLPPGYDPQGEQRYPVLYLLHGQDSEADQWIKMGITTTADVLIENHLISPLIIVMPHETNSLIPEQTNFGEAVSTALVSWIDTHYLTQADREGRAIGGLSRGAAWAMRLGLIYWQTYGAIGAHSFPMFYGDGVLIPKWLAAIPPESYPRIYMDIGKGDEGRPLVQEFEASLTDLGVPHEFHLFLGYHEEAYWQAHLEDYLYWYTAAW